MYELSYYHSITDLNKLNRNFESVGIYGNRILAMGMRKKKALEPQFRLELLKVVSV